MNKPLSRQHLHQIRLKELGRCGKCSKKLHPVLQTCEPCLTKNRLRAREKKGYKERVMGGRGRPRKCVDDTGTEATNEIQLIMSKADFGLSDHALSKDLGISTVTISKYRKIFTNSKDSEKKTDAETIMANADYSLSNKELIFALQISKPTVEKYRRLYAPETVKPPRPYTKKAK